MVSAGRERNFLPRDKVSVSSPLTSRPVVKGKAPRSKQERARLLPSAAPIRATRSSHWVSKDGIHEEEKEKHLCSQLTRLCRDKNTKEQRVQ